MAKNPTKKQRELLDFIDDFMQAHGFSPSYREIMRALHYRSVSTVATHVENLAKGGFLQKTDHAARSLEVVLSQSNEYDNASHIKPSQEKWLVEIITAKFKDLNNAQPSQKEIDDLFVLVGALHVLGLQNAAAAFKAKLTNIAPIS